MLRRLSIVDTYYVPCAPRVPAAIQCRTPIGDAVPDAARSKVTSPTVTGPTALDRVGVREYPWT
jgi:hypothetical protein